MIKTDRSRIETYQRCPRRRWIEYEADRGLEMVGEGDEYLTPPVHPGGYTPDKPAFALEIGSGFHKGMEYVLSKVRDKEWPEYASAQSALIACAVDDGIAEYEKEILPYFGKVSTPQARDVAYDLAEYDGIEEDEPFNNYTVSEGRALVEALIRVYCAAPAGLKALLEEYEILEVESEMEVPLNKCMRCAGSGRITSSEREGSALRQTTRNCYDCNGKGGSLILMSRLDAIGRNRKDGQLYVIEFKSTGKWDRRKAETGRYDTQGLSQLIAAEHKYGEKFAGVQMVYAVKGYKMQDKFDGLWKVHNGIVRPYMKHGVTSEDDQYAFSYEYINEDGEVKRLGKGWNKVNIWESGPDAIKDWVRTLAEGDQPNCCPDLLDKMVIMPAPFYRDGESMEEWREEAILQETLIDSMSKIANADDTLPAVRRATLNGTFNKYRHSCSYPTRCPWIPVCHEGVPVEGMGVKPRKANHPSEVENG